MPHRLFISNIPNCKPFRKIEIAEVDYVGRYQWGGGGEDYQIPEVCFPHQYQKKREDIKF